MKLNTQQIKAASFLHGICVVIAVPGSGKTKTMMERIKILITKNNIPPEHILGLTFTRNAAEEMRHRLEPILGNIAGRVMLLTLHSFCHFLLRSEGYVFEILQGKDQIIFIRDIIKKLRYRELATGSVLQEISLCKNNLISPEEMKALYEGDTTMLKMATVYEIYQTEKNKKMLMDFDDLLYETYQLLYTNEDIRNKYQQTYRHVLIDEFQDTNPAQMEIVKLLRGDNLETSLFVLGDDWQSIYAFTGASVGNILNFHKTFPESEQFILDLNYRSTPQILKACQNLIAYNERKIEKQLVTHNGNGEELIVLESETEESEALALVNEIRDLAERRYIPYKDMVVLYRANFQSRYVEEMFSQHKIPYHITNGLNFYHRTEVRILLDYLRLINNPDSPEGDEALLGVINVPNRYIGKTFTKDLEEFAAKREIHLYKALKQIIIDLPYIRKNVKSLIQFLDPLIEEKMPPAELIALLRSTLDYDRYITDDDVPGPDDVKIANLNQLQLAATKYPDITSFLAFTETFEGDNAHDKDGVALMTIHKSKGLEFPVVFVIGLVEGIMPTKRGDMEEERRICFVAISRAMQLLYLSYSKIYLGQACSRSMFIDEIMGTKSVNKKRR
jgi:DNA helicase-2/ATP-dependent DNA helicase PcrA